MTPDQILSHIRNIPDFPRKGILFKDITTALNKPEVLHAIIDALFNLIKDIDVDYIAAIESRGFIFGAPLAYKKNAGLILIRKKGKLPADVWQQEYQLEYGTDTLEMHKNAFPEGAKILIVDDLLATGGTLDATINLVQKAKGNVVGSLFLIELTELSANAHTKAPVFSLLKI